jgi:hypothetical protein
MPADRRSGQTGAAGRLRHLPRCRCQGWAQSVQLALVVRAGRRSSGWASGGPVGCVEHPVLQSAGAAARRPASIGDWLGKCAFVCVLPSKNCVAIGP